MLAVKARAVFLKRRYIPLDPRATPLKLCAHRISQAIPSEGGCIVVRRRLGMRLAGLLMSRRALRSLLALCRFHEAATLARPPH